MPKFKNYAAACKSIGKDPKAQPDVTGLDKDEAKRVISAFRWERIVAAYNGGWKPNYKDSNEGKYEIWADMRASSFGLYNVYCYCTLSRVGSRLCFKSRELAQQAVKDFPKDFKNYMLG